MIKFSVICMAIAFLFAGLSAMMFWGQGFRTWIWQIVCMIWIANAFFLEMRLSKLQSEFQTDKKSSKA